MAKDKKKPWVGTYKKLRLNEVLKKEYGIEVKSFDQVKAVMKVQTKEGPLCVKRYNDPEGNLLFIYSVVDHLLKKGFSRTAKFLTTKKDLPYFQAGSQLFYVTDWLDGKEPDFSNRDELMAATECLAQFHQCARGYTPIPGSKPVNMLGKWPKAFEKRSADLLYFRKLAAANKEPGDIDRHFVDYTGYYNRVAEVARKILAESAYEQLCQKAAEEKCFTHRDVAARNFIYAPTGQAHLIDFDYARMEIRVDDLNRLIERTLRNFRWDFEICRAIIEKYNSVNPLAPEEYPVLLAFLAFPQKFWRSGSRYYIHKGARPDKELISKLVKLEEQKNVKERFLKDFAACYCPETEKLLTLE